MNRKERRRAGKQINEPVMTLKRSEAKQVVDEIVQAELKKIQVQDLDIFLHLLCIAAEAEFGFKKGRLIRLVERIQKQYQAIQDNQLSKEDIRDYCRNTLSINMEVRA